MGEFVLTIGGSLMDIKGKPVQGLEPGTSNPALIRSTRGGTARNVAENLGRLGADVVLVSAVGDDDTGRRLRAVTGEAGVDMTYVQMVPGARTGQYMAVIDDNGQLAVALDDTAVMEYVSADYLRRHERLFADADMVLLDGGLTPEAMRTAVELATEHNVPICADPSSSRLAPRLITYLPQLSLVVPNELEAAAICDADYLGFDIEASTMMARQIMSRGVKNVIVTLSDFGLVYATGEESGYVPARYSDMIDSTGTGDAITAAVIFGMINDLSPVECMRLGAAAASLTLQTGQSVYRNLSLDLLYDHLTV